MKETEKIEIMHFSQEGYVEDPHLSALAAL